MKSIMEEASSVLKAIEKAWQRAEKPQQFQIKVYEEEEKNFLGMTTKSAKIGLFFEEKKEQFKQSRPKTISKKPAAPLPQKPKPQIQQIEQPVQKKNNRRVRNGWNDEMVAIADNWLREMLNTINATDVNYTTDVSGKYLKFTLSKPIFDNQKKERILFSNCSHLILATMRNRFKKALSDLKVILNS